MEITDQFRVSRPIDETWKVLLDIERIAPCLPGAQLEEIEGDEFRGVVKVKVGPITVVLMVTPAPSLLAAEAVRPPRRRAPPLRAIRSHRYERRAHREEP